ncbi:MAG: radical SAM family heme chaperone HemW, partial [Gammaproteobacteria bacterium]
MFRFDVLPPLALYLHLPWCVRKCPYCDFNSHELKSDLPEQAYVDALLADIEFELPGIWGRTVQSIFIGGGTPSLFSPEAIDRLLAGVRSRLRCKPALEVTLEANPGTVEQGRFAEYRAAGVNRLSIGVQSFQTDLLERLGRIHDRREAIRAAESAHGAGLENFNLDLMFGLPGQNPAACLTDVATALDLEPAHISFYQLTLEPNTRFHRYPPVLPEEDVVWTMQEQGRAALEAGGYTQYEISASARPGRQCDHNLNY